MASMERLVSRRALPWILLSLAVVAQAADDGGALAGKEKARVALNMLMTMPGGATGKSISMGPFDLGPGEKTFATAVFAAQSESQGCTWGMSIGGVEKALATHALVWTAIAEVVEVTTDNVVLAVTWERVKSGENGQPTKLAGESGAKLTLREGDRTLLDFADRAPSGEPFCMRNFALEVTAEVAEDPSLTAQEITYDVWLVHEVAGGTKTSRRLEIAGSQGQELPFRFPDETVKVAPGTKADEPETELRVDVKGSVRGRLRHDGSVDLSVETERLLSYGPSEGGGEHVGEGGAKMLHARPEEAIRIELPGAPQNTQRPERYARDLAGHSFALILTAKPLR